ncbi:MAG TPA: rubrerythrin family protein [Candidatus Ozemobacteraceae bacterium]|nr:rubrerythrin family protein [Candidatus Ozemobacteraceae bacterium]HQG29469.1 rubrerythrin family protein [Candidatus Ozemobacteraceae bacterium]
MKRIVVSLFAVSLLMTGALFAQNASPDAAATPDVVIAPAEPTPAAPVAAQVAGNTLENMLTAFNGESNAQAKYTEFAKKADEEGYLGVGSLFRAAAKAEGVHAANLKAEIEKQGGKAEPKLETPVVKTTKENLEAAIAGETHETEKMYPEFKATAETEKQDMAVVLFGGAAKVEGDHARMYAEALKDLDAMKAGKKDFFVCLVCGYTTGQAPADKCPVCMSPKEKFEKVN